MIRFGFSRLGDIIRQGIDPHSYTAAMFADVSLEQFSGLPDRKQLRQQAKAINFGIPGGLGAAALVDYAKHTYAVEISQQQASEFRIMLTERVYPEVNCTCLKIQHPFWLESYRRIPFKFGSY